MQNKYESLGHFASALIWPKGKIGSISFGSALVVIVVLHGLANYPALLSPENGWQTFLLSLPVFYALICVFACRFNMIGRSPLAVLAPFIVTIFLSLFVYFISLSMLSENLLQQSYIASLETGADQEGLGEISTSQRQALVKELRETGKLDHAARLSQLRSFTAFWLVMLVAGLWAAIARDR